MGLRAQGNGDAFMHMVQLLHSEYHEYKFQPCTFHIAPVCLDNITVLGAPPIIVLGDRQVPVFNHTWFWALSQIENVSLAVDENQEHFETQMYSQGSNFCAHKE